MGKVKPLYTLSQIVALTNKTIPNNLLPFPKSQWRGPRNLLDRPVSYQLYLLSRNSNQSWFQSVDIFYNLYKLVSLLEALLFLNFVRRYIHTRLIDSQKFRFYRLLLILFQFRFQLVVRFMWNWGRFETQWHLCHSRVWLGCSHDGSKLFLF